MSARTRSVAAAWRRNQRRAKKQAAQLEAAQHIDVAVLHKLIVDAQRKRRWRPVWFGRPQPRNYSVKKKQSSIERAVSRLRKARHHNGR